MKRRISIGMCALLTACFHSAESPINANLQPEQVLQKAAKATQKLESSQYVLQGDFDVGGNATQSLTGTLRMDGILRNAGEQVRFQMDTTAEIDDAQGSSTLDATLEVVMISDDEVYLNIHSLLTQPSDILFRPDVVGKLASQWWLLPPGDTAPRTVNITPDPKLLQAQAQVVSVTKDRGIVDLLSRKAHHYDIKLDEKKLVEYLQTVAIANGNSISRVDLQSSIEGVEAAGQLWIDAETFHVLKLSWVIQSFPLQSGQKASASFEVTFRNINDAPAILAPEDVKVFSPDVFFSKPSTFSAQGVPIFR